MRSIRYAILKSSSSPRIEGTNSKIVAIWHYYYIYDSNSYFIYYYIVFITSERIEQTFCYFDPTHIANHFYDGKHRKHVTRCVSIKRCFGIRKHCNIREVYFVYCIFWWYQELSTEQTRAEISQNGKMCTLK